MCTYLPDLFQPAIAARAFQHILSLATAHRMAVKQPQAYGEIEIQLQ